MTVHAGRLRHRLRVERAEVRTDEVGVVRRRWDLVCRVWASVSPIRGRELLQADQSRSHITHRVTMRGGADVRHGDRLVHARRVLHVESVTDRDERQRELEIMCVEDAGGEQVDGH